MAHPNGLIDLHDFLDLRCGYTVVLELARVLRFPPLPGGKVVGVRGAGQAAVARGGLWGSGGTPAGSRNA